MRLDELLPAGTPGVLRAPDRPVEIDALVYDSRRARPGSLFFCVPGERSDGHDFASRAVAAGAAALVLERPLDLGVEEVLVQSARAAMAPAAVRFNGDPTGFYAESGSQLRVIGITGTNGKTTTAFMVRALIEAAGRERCGLLGTVKGIVGGQERPAARTTPEAIDLQADFRAMLDAGEGSCAMEVSSHALALGRTAGVRFAAAIFTNLTQDHLDFHGSMEDYFQAKRLLFLQEGGLKVINLGDPYGQRLAAELPAAITFGIDCDADYCATDISVGREGTSARLQTPAGSHDLLLPLPGAFNLANALGALAAVHGLNGAHGGSEDADIKPLLAALARGVRVPGRFEPVDEGQDFAVLVDYAHTPDSLENVLRAARELTARRLICVFGAGGDRDRGKRPLMGEIGARLADVAIVTSDNPRSEDPQQIVAEVLAGASKVSGAQVIVEPDRRQAIAAAIAQAQADDIVVIAGKGHEQGQELAGGVKIPFDDATVAREELR
ncbi:MAG TPA: UDP-N-acetylmuramoyl-L-alanyl-D-glutamate--2,6-diaminopimelate ligase [Solirubrobacteraceae bacterium]